MPIDTRPVNTSTVTDPATVACPYCRTSDRTRRTTDTGRIRAWSCDNCGTDWAFSLVRPDSRAAALLTTDLAAAAQEVGRLRWALAQVVTLADEMPKLADVELRTRLLALAESCAGEPASPRPEAPERMQGRMTAPPSS
jgi:ribosomal protein L37AE/L43A